MADGNTVTVKSDQQKLKTAKTIKQNSKSTTSYANSQTNSVNSYKSATTTTTTEQSKNNCDRNQQQQSSLHYKPNTFINRTTIVDGKTVNASKHAKVIHRTTSESLRLSMNNNLKSECFEASSSNSSLSNGTSFDSNCESSSRNSSPNQSKSSLMMTNNGSLQQLNAADVSSTSSSSIGNGPAMNTMTTTTTTTITSHQQHHSISSDLQTASNILTSTPPMTTMAAKPKQSSYQITSITVGTRTSADEDSADDLDESHTTDENSRVTDMENETPSLSEDTYSKDDVFAAAYAHGIAPMMAAAAAAQANNVGVTSADLANCVTTTGVSGNVGNANVVAMNAANAANSVAANANDNKKLPDVRVSVANISTGDKNKGVEIKGSERFKVVKIESIEPFKRGRWTCMDFLDQSAKQQTNHMNFGGKTENGVANVDGDKKKITGKSVQTEIITNNEQNSMATTAHLIAGQSAPGGGMPSSATTSPGQTLQQPIQAFNQTTAQLSTNVTPATVNVLATGVDGGNYTNLQQTSHAQTLSHVPNNNVNVNNFQTSNMAASSGGNVTSAPTTFNTVAGQSLPQQQLQQIVNAMPHMQQQQQPPQQQQQQPQQMQNFQSQQTPFAQNQSMGGSHSAHVTQTIPIQQIHEIHQYQQQYQNSIQQGQSTPTPFYSQVPNDGVAPNASIATPSTNGNEIYQPQTTTQSQSQNQTQYSNQQQQPSSQQIQSQQATATTQQFQPTMQQQTMPTNSNQMQSHGQTLPAGVIQGMVLQNNVQTGANVALPVTAQMQPQMVNVSQGMSMGHLPNNVELSMNMSTANSASTNVVSQQQATFVPAQRTAQAQLTSATPSAGPNSCDTNGQQNQAFANTQQTANVVNSAGAVNANVTNDRTNNSVSASVVTNSSVISGQAQPQNVAGTGFVDGQQQSHASQPTGSGGNGSTTVNQQATTASANAANSHSVDAQAGTSAVDGSAAAAGAKPSTSNADEGQVADDAER